MAEWDVVSENPIEQSVFASKKQKPKALSGADQWQVAGQAPVDEAPLDWYRKQLAERQVPESPDFIGTMAGGVDINLPSKRKMLAEAMPILGDIALTAAAPEIKGATVLARLANYGMRGAAAAAGGFGGELARQKILGRENLDFGQAGRQALAGGLGETGTGLAISGIKKFGAPMLNLVGDFSSAAKPLSRKAFAFLQAEQAKAKNLGTQRAIDFVESLAVPSSEDLGLEVGKAILKKSDFNKAYAPWNEAIDQLAKEGNGEILLDDTTEYISNQLIRFWSGNKGEDKAIKDFIDWLGFSGDPRSTATIKQMMRDGFVGPNDAKYVMANFWKKSYGTTTDAANKWKEGLKAAFLGDIDRQSPGAGVAKLIGDKTKMAMDQFFRESPWSSRIIKKMDFGRSDRLYFEDYPERIGEYLFKKSPDEIRQVRNAVSLEKGGRKAWKMFSLDYVKNIFESSMSRNPITGSRAIKPAELADKIYEAEEVIKAALPLAEWRRLAKEADHFRALAPKFETIPVNDGFGLLQAWSILSPKSHGLLKSVFDKALKGAGAATKATMHMGTSLYDIPSS